MVDPADAPLGVEACLATLARAPDDAGTADALAAALARLGDVEAAWSAWRSLAERYPDSVRFLEELARLRPDDPAPWRALARLHAAAWRLEPAHACLERALALGPGDDDDISQLGWLKAELGDTDGALARLATPAPMAFGRRVRHALMLPQVYRDAADLAAWRQRYGDGLAELAARPDAACPEASEVFSLSQSNFLLAYQGGNDLALQRRYSELLGHQIARARPDLVAPIPRRRGGGGRIRVAFVSAFLRECTIGHYFRAWIEGLDRARFDTALVYTGQQADAVTRVIGAAAGRFVVQRDGVLALAGTLRELAPDILIYPEVGMDSDGYLLANMRLAPIQCAAWGHPVTTGAGVIDHYFTCGEMEPEGAERHYRERLIRLPGLGTRYAEPSGIAAIDRAALGLPVDRRLYVCPQSLFKVHPDNDALCLDILAADPGACLVFFQSQARRVTLAFADRLARGLARRGLTPRNQIKFLPRLDAGGFRAALALADVVLDTLHWSGGNTSLDALSAGAAIVTLPGAFMRGRQSRAMLGALGLEELVATSPEDYVAKALAVAADPARRDALRRRIAAGRGALFDRDEPLRALEAELLRLYEGG